jgi:ACS family pantothenate transporter-like MFS transporter
LIFYPVPDAPDYRKGYVASIVAGALILPLALMIAFLEKRGVEDGTLGRKFDKEEEPEEQEAGVVAMDLPEKV